MIYGNGSYSDLKTKFTLIAMSPVESEIDPVEHAFANLIEEIEHLLDYYDSTHLEHGLMQIKSSLGLYQFFKSEDFVEYED